MDEWYKAAFYDPTPGAGDGDSYWTYPTRSDATPDSSAPPGGVNHGNFFRDDGLANGINDGYALGTADTSPVGAYHQTSSHYGIFDFLGNVTEWTETEVMGSRMYRGGSFALSEFYSSSGVEGGDLPTFESEGFGFRLASAVPEPSAALLVLIAAAGLSSRRRRIRAPSPAGKPGSPSTAGPEDRTATRRGLLAARGTVNTAG